MNVGKERVASAGRSWALIPTSKITATNHWRKELQAGGPPSKFALVPP